MAASPFHEKSLQKPAKIKLTQEFMPGGWGLVSLVQRKITPQFSHIGSPHETSLFVLAADRKTPLEAMRAFVIHE
jgi:hypothetical protein